MAIVGGEGAIETDLMNWEVVFCPLYHGKKAGPETEEDKHPFRHNVPVVAIEPQASVAVGTDGPDKQTFLWSR